jgi:thymidylate synthase
MLTMINFDLTYKSVASQILQYGKWQKCNSQPSKALFNQSFGFPGHIIPLLTLRKIPYSWAIQELNWILSGSSNINKLPVAIQKIWQPWANQDGHIPSAYGRYLRRYPAITYPDYGEAISGTPVTFREIDQLTKVVEGLLNDTPSRRLHIKFHHPDNFWASSLPPCIDSLAFNWYPNGGIRYLSVNIKFRSSDFMLGFTWDIFQYYLLAQAIIKVVNTLRPECNYQLQTYTFSADNIHIYEPHLPNTFKLLQVPATHPISWDNSLLEVEHNSLCITKVNFKLPTRYTEIDKLDIPFEMAV